MLDLKAEDYREDRRGGTRMTGGKKHNFNAHWNKCELQHWRKFNLVDKMIAES